MARAKVVLLGAAGLGVVVAAGVMWLLLSGSPSSLPGAAVVESNTVRKDAPAEGAAAADPGTVVVAAAPVSTGGRIFGRLVRGSPPSPVAGEISISGKGLAARKSQAGEDGRFLVENLPRETPLEVLATAPGLLPARFPGIFIERRGPYDLGDVVLGPPLRLEVRVRDKGDRPVAGATVSMVRNRSWSANTDWVAAQLRTPAPPSPEATLKTDEKGVVVFESAPAGTWQVIADAEGYGRAGAYANVAEGEAREPVRILMLPACGLEGTVFAADGKPLPGVVVLGVPTTAPWPQDLYRVSATADAQGVYKLAGFAEGVVDLSVLVMVDFKVGVGQVQLPGVRRFDIRLSPGFTVKGKVLDDATGAPVAGARVSLQTQNPQGGSAGQGTVRRETAADGTYSIENMPVGNFGTVQVRKEGFLDWPDSFAGQPLWGVPAVGAVEERDARLHKGAAVRGKVLDGAGKPVPSARVQIYAMNPTSGFSQIDPVLAGADGTYRVEGVPQGKVLLAATAQGYYQPKFPMNYWQPLQSGVLPEECSVEVPREGEAAKDLVLSGGGVVEGVVTAPDGSPAAGVRVWATGVQPARGLFGIQALTDAEGKFRIPGVMGGEEFTVRAVGSKGENGVSDPTRVADGETVTGIRVALKAAGGIAGRVRREDGRSAQGAILRAVPTTQDGGQNWNFEAQVRSTAMHPVGPEGDFRIENLAVGKYSLFASAEGAAAAPSVAVEVTEGSVKEGVDVLIPVERPISGQVVDDSRAPVAGARIVVREERQDRGMMMMQGGWNDAVAAITDAEGRFTLAGLGDKGYDVSADAPGYVRESAKTKGGATDLVLVLSRGLVIGGVVVDDGDGKPIPDVAITVNPVVTGPQSGVWRGKQGKTGKDGAFVLDGFDPDLEYMVTAGQQWGGKGEHTPKTQQKVKAGTTDLRISLVRGLPISGTLVDELGAPVTQRVGLQAIGRNAEGNPDYQRNRWAQSEIDGTFRIGGLEAGVYDLTINTGWNQQGGNFAPASMKGVAAGTEGLAITLRKGLPISGKVVDDKGDPVKQQTWIMIAPSGEAQSGTNMSNAMVQDGSFTTPALDVTKTYDLTSNQLPGLMGGTAKGIAPGAKDVILRMSKGGSISGRCVDEAGNALGKGVPVNASAELPPNSPPNQPGAQGWAATKDDGTFAIEALGDFKFKVRAGGQNSDFAPTAADGLHSTGATDLVVRVKPGVTLAGKLLNAAGEPFQAQMFMGQPEGVDGVNPSYTNVKEDGTFSLKGLPAGKVRLKAYGGKDWIDLGVHEAPASNLALTMPEVK